MAEHLPYYGHEQGCYNSKIPWGPEPCSGCVSLRQAEARGIQKALIAWKEAEPLHDAEVRADALDAARDAVAAVEMGGEHFWSVGFRDGITIALAAIDALRGESNG